VWIKIYSKIPMIMNNPLEPSKSSWKLYFLDPPTVILLNFSRYYLTCVLLYMLIIGILPTIIPASYCSLRAAKYCFTWYSNSTHSFMFLPKLELWIYLITAYLCHLVMRIKIYIFLYIYILVCLFHYLKSLLIKSITKPNIDILG
jgi:hypothetical protein